MRASVIRKGILSVYYHGKLLSATATSIHAFIHHIDTFLPIVFLFAIVVVTTVLFNVILLPVDIVSLFLTTGQRMYVYYGTFSLFIFFLLSSLPNYVAVVVVVDVHIDCAFSCVPRLFFKL